MGKLQEIGEKYGTDKATIHRYLDFYETILPKNPKRVLEIGVMQGASLKMWAEYYPEAQIVGIDAFEAFPEIDLEEAIVLRMDGTNHRKLSVLGKFDLIIDDASHLTQDQQTSFEYLYNNSLNPGGIYIIEDIHTSYWTDWVNSELTTVEYLKKFWAGKTTVWYGEQGKEQTYTAVIKK